MSHHCGGPSCLRTQGRRSECTRGCNRTTKPRYRTFEDSEGVTREVTDHAERRLKQHSVSDADMDKARNRWDAYGECDDGKGGSNMNYWTFLPDGRMISVVFSMDDKRIVTVLEDDILASRWHDRDSSDRYLFSKCFWWDYWE